MLFAFRFCLLLTYLCGHTVFALGAAPGQVLPGSGTKRSCVIAAFRSQTGVREQGGANRGPAVAAYLKACKLPEGYPWCAAFVAYCLHDCGIHPEARNAWAAAWFPPDKIVYKRGSRRYSGRTNAIPCLPRPGDVCGFCFGPKPGISHVGFVEQWGDQITLTTEGNTNGSGGREGDGVYRMRRLTRSIAAVSDWIDR